jgi:hypothetical protein
MSTNQNQNQVQPEQQGRVVVTRGRQQTAQDFKVDNEFTTYKLFNPQHENKLKLWQHKGGPNTWDTPYFTAFRLLPALSTATQAQIDAGEEVTAKYLAGRNIAEDLPLNVGMIRTIRIVEGFGSRANKRVTFIPRIVWEPADYEDYPPYEGPFTNPYVLLRDRLMTLGEDIHPNLRLLTLSAAKFREEVIAHARTNFWQIRDQRVIKPLLPAPQTNMISYVWIYKGYDLSGQKDVLNYTNPIGSLPGSQLNVMLMKSSVYDKLARLYAEVAQVEGKMLNQWQYPDPALPDAGCINYVWNIAQQNPVTGARGKEAVGYDVTASLRFHQYPGQDGHQARIQFTPEYTKWYYDNWLPWEESLEGTTGLKQVHLIAEYFPELGPAAAIAWKDDPILMDEWKKAPFIREIEQVNLWSIIKRLYGNNNAPSAPSINTQQPAPQQWQPQQPQQQQWTPQQPQQQQWQPHQQQPQQMWAPQPYTREPQNYPAPPPVQISQYGQPQPPVQDVTYTQPPQYPQQPPQQWQPPQQQTYQGIAPEDYVQQQQPIQPDSNDPYASIDDVPFNTAPQNGGAAGNYGGRPSLLNVIKTRMGGKQQQPTQQQPTQQQPTQQQPTQQQPAVDNAQHPVGEEQQELWRSSLRERAKYDPRAAIILRNLGETPESDPHREAALASVTEPDTWGV